MKNFILCISVLFVIVIATPSYAVSFVNGSFEEPGILSDWTTHGVVSQVSSGTVSFDVYSYNITAQEGNSMALLSAPGLSGGGSYSDNWISQNLAGFQAGKISFYYNMFSTDWLGNDGFLVKFYDEYNNEIYDWEINENAADKSIVDYVLYSSGWQLFSHDFGPHTGPLSMDMNIKLASGNGGDDNWNTWTYLDNFTVTPAVPVPILEPGAAIMLALALLGLGGIKRRYR